MRLLPSDFDLLGKTWDEDQVHLRAVSISSAGHHSTTSGPCAKMSTKSDIQALLRFLAQDAKVPLPTAMGKVKDLQAAKLTRCEKHGP